MRHLIDQLIDILILDILILGLHDIGHILVEDIHALFLCHETFHSFRVVLAFHFVACAGHDFCHAGHDVLHGFVYGHLLESRIRDRVTRM